jgi:hypothetical protein
MTGVLPVRTEQEIQPACPAPIRNSNYLPEALSVRYWVGVILQVFLKTRQK